MGEQRGVAERGQQLAEPLALLEDALAGAPLAEDGVVLSFASAWICLERLGEAC